MTAASLTARTAAMRAKTSAETTTATFARIFLEIMPGSLARAASASRPRGCATGADPTAMTGATRARTSVGATTAALTVVVNTFWGRNKFFWQKTLFWPNSSISAAYPSRNLTDFNSIWAALKLIHGLHRADEIKHGRNSTKTRNLNFVLAETEPKPVEHY